jgi:division protein CdvB (Snf7/Vps24/ESCRT-III family)
LAKQLVQTRSNKARLYQTQGSMSQAQTQMTHASTNVAMSKAMGKTAKVMGAVNRATPVAQQQKMMMAFEKNKEALEMKNEMMDDVLGGEELSDEADEMLDSVFESIGLDVKGSLPATGGSLPESAKMTAAEEEEVAKLLAGI